MAHDGYVKKTMDTPQEIESFFDLLYEHVDRTRKTEDKLEVARKLEQELERSRTANRTLNTDYNVLLGTDNFNINTRFLNLKATHNYLLKEVDSLGIKLENLKIDLIEKKNTISLKTDRHIKTIEELGKKKVQEIKEKIHNRKLKHSNKVEQLNNELELAQAAIDLEHDEIETMLRRELIDLNTKIWRQQKHNTDLQFQIDEFTRRENEKTKQVCVKESDADADLNFFQLKQLDELFENYSSNNYSKTEPCNANIDSKCSIRNKTTQKLNDIFITNPENISRSETNHFLTSSTTKSTQKNNKDKHPFSSNEIIKPASLAKNITETSKEVHVPLNNPLNNMCRNKNNVQTSIKDSEEGQIEIKTNLANSTLKSIFKDKRKESKINTPIFEYSKPQNILSKKVNCNTVVLQKTKNHQKHGKKYETNSKKTTEKIVQNSAKRLKLFDLNDLNYLDNMDLDASDSD